MTYSFSSFSLHGVINSQVLKIIKEMFALYTCELLKEGSRKPGVLCICRIIFDEKYAIDTEFVPTGILSRVSPVSWPRPRWPLAPLASPGHKSCNRPVTQPKLNGLSRNFSFFDLRSQMLTFVNAVNVPTVMWRPLWLSRTRSHSQFEKVCNVSFYRTLTWNKARAHKRCNCIADEI